MFKLLMIILVLFTIATAKLKATATETVYLQNYDLAETDYTFYQTLNYTGSLGKIGFLKVPTPVTSDVQTVVRMNRDTLYGYGVFDLNCSVTIELPANKGRYLSLYALDNYQYSLALLHSNETKSASITLSYQNADNNTNVNSHSHEKKQSNINKVISDTRYIYVIIRVFADPNDPVDVLKANLLQDAIKVTQTSVGEWSWPNWSIDSLVEVRTALSSLESYIEPNTQINGYRSDIDPTVHLIATATSWGGNPPEEAVYFLVSPPSLTDLSQVYYIDIESPSSIPVKSTGFWSITVYNENNYLEYNNASSYSVNGVTATPESDGSIRIYFSNTQGDDMSNWLYIFPGWNYVVRLYLPEDVVINNTWTFPALQDL